MPRPLVIGNGSLLVTLDGELSLRDFYWPYVGLHNHLSGHRARLGLWLDGRFCWLSEGGWEQRLGYEPNTLVTHVVAEHRELGVTLTLQDCVLQQADVLLRRFTLKNNTSTEREARLFLSHNFHIAETDIGDTAFYNPFLDAVIHYKRDCYFLLSGETDTVEPGGLYQYAIGIKGFGGAEGTWRDAEDGWLSMNAVAQGSVDSTYSLRAILPPNGQAELRTWICVGSDLEAVAALQTRLRSEGFDALAHDTARYWTSWSEKEAGRLTELPPEVASLFRRSLLTIRTNIDNRGAIIAANDSDIMETARAHYSYMWPRDGALVACALDRLGYEDITRRFFEFCRNVLPQDRAALLHKYSADGSWGSTWHPWVYEGIVEVPFQQDSTNLVLYALWQHYRQHQDIEFIQSLYRDFIRPAAEFLAAYRHPETGLPLPSYDLWEERRGVHAYTCGTLYGALEAAANLASIFDDTLYETVWRQAAREVREGIETHLWDEGAGRFARRLVYPSPDSPVYERDLTVDSASHAIYAFGALPPGDRRVVAMMEAIQERLAVRTGVGGYARYERDYYFRRSEDFERIPGNPWFICTLWVTQWHIARAQSRADLTPALDLLEWTARHALSTGVLAEQLHPETGEPLSVAPLTWSHAEFVATVLDYLDQVEDLAG